MTYSRIAVVTGANKGIGLAIVRSLALTYPASTFNNGPFLIYLTARNQERGEGALRKLRQDPELHQAAALSQDGGLTDIKYHELDIAEPESIGRFREFLVGEHGDGIDFVINNAGIAMDGFDTNVVTQTLRTNYHGTLLTTLSLLPHVRPGGRLINVSSMAGSLAKYSPALRARFRAATTVADVTALMDEFEVAVGEGREGERGWPSAAYAVSKAGVVGVTGVIAGEGRDGKGGEGNGKNGNVGKGVLVNSCCPGWVKTDMTKGKGWKSVEEGARTPVLLALGDLGGRTGGFWQDEREREW